MAAPSSASPVAASTGSAITVAASPSMGGAGTGNIGGTGSPCAACKFLRRRCQRDCVFAPYFPPDNPQKFVNVHRVFGASNVTKILKDLPDHHREDAVNSLAYEAEMRHQDPVYGCVGVISILQHRLRQAQQELACATHELSKYQAAAAAAEAATGSVAVVSNGAAAAGMADFVVGNPPVLNFAQTNFINVGPSTAAPMGGGAGFVQNDYLASVQMLARSHEAAAAARVGANNGGGGVGVGSGYAFGYCSSAMGAAGHGVVPDQLGQIGGGGKFLKPGTASGDE